ncbi:MAG: YggS family pyridoxal phosphate-dependent enzyme [Acidimicrobiia bacterium]
MSVDGSDPIAVHVAEVRDRIAAAARAAGRDPGTVRLVAATKTQPVERVRALVAAGVGDLGENRAQELVAKAPALADLRPTWHFIGRLQRNKINQLAPFVRWWQTLDRIELVDALAQRVPGARALVEVNVSGEAQKGGCAPGEAERLVAHGRARGLEVVGLMTVAAATGDPRRSFAALADLARRCEVPELSMGMSGDLEAAIAEGATIVRVGTTLLGTRPTFH